MGRGPPNTLLAVMLFGDIKEGDDDAHRSSGFGPGGPARTLDPAQRAVISAMYPQHIFEMRRQRAGGDRFQHGAQAIPIFRVHQRQSEAGGRFDIPGHAQHPAKFGRPIARACRGVEIPDTQPRRLDRKPEPFLALGQVALGHTAGVDVLQRAIPANDSALIIATRARSSTHPSISAVA